MEVFPSRVGGRYDVVRLLDEGGHSRVFLARDTRLGRLVALKLLKPELGADAALTARLEREVRLVASLSHPNLVALYDWQTDEAGQYAVLEYVPGENLKVYVQRRGRLGTAEAIGILRQVLDALEAVHQAGIVHRDVKPQNVLVVGSHNEERSETTGSMPAVRPSPRVKLTDLGIARVAVDLGQTPLGTTIGTPHYLSPEQARGETATPASDVYSAGAVLYELLVGRPPFEGDSPLAVTHQHAYVQPKPPSDAVPGLSPRLDAIVLRALAKDPGERYPTAAAFATALDGLASDQVQPTVSLPALPTGATQGSARAGALRQLLTLLAAGLVMIFALSGLLGLLSSASATRPTPTPTAGTSPTALALVATPTPRALSTVTPTALPPTATATARPTQTPAPTPPPPTPTRTATPSPTPIPTPTETVARLTVQPLSALNQSLGVLRGDGGRVSLAVTVTGGRDDILLTVLRGDAIVRSQRRIAREERVEIADAAAGEYRVLLDNRISLITSKLVTVTWRILEPG